MDQYELISEYIQSAWRSAVKKGSGEFPLPFDYVPPCIDGDLTHLYYWDTYFTNLGLYCDGLGEYALGNIEDLKFCLRKFGCVPNMCRANGAEVASQPPLLSLMVRDAYELNRDRAFLQDSYEALLKEYDFWMTERLAPNGLNRYGTNCTDRKRLLEISRLYAERVKKDLSRFSEEEMLLCAQNAIAEGESGEDHTARFGGVATEINPIDLNCYLYAFERNMAYFSEILKNGCAELWQKRAQIRLEKMRKYCYDESTGVYFDYNYKKNKRTGIFCAACYLPYVVGIPCDGAAIAQINGKLTYPFGVVSCEELPFNGEVYQWGFPNVWAPHNFFAYLANKRTGNLTAAKEIRKKFLSVVADTFMKYKKLYEKYDAVVGGEATVSEYGTPEMLGWTAGVYQYFYKQCRTFSKNAVQIIRR